MFSRHEAVSGVKDDIARVAIQRDPHTALAAGDLDPGGVGYVEHRLVGEGQVKLVGSGVHGSPFIFGLRMNILAHS